MQHAVARQDIEDITLAWPHARVHLLVERVFTDAVVLPIGLHRFGDVHYYTWAGRQLRDDDDASEEAYPGGRAAVFHLVCGPPHPRHRVAGTGGNEAIMRASNELFVRIAQTRPGMLDEVDVFHPIVVVNGIKSRHGARLESCRFERRQIAIAYPRWIDLVAAHSLDAFITAATHHYARFYERRNRRR